MFAGLVIFALIASAFAQVPGRGPCPDVTLIQGFQLAQYLGLWHTYQQYPATFSLGATCITAKYGLNPNGTVSVVNSQIDRNGNFDSIEGHARIVSDGKLIVTFPGQPVDGNYWVLDTDYDNFAVVYSCTRIATIRTG
jgi:apolipoprotein D and lipocalin family protein